MRRALCSAIFLLCAAPLAAQTPSFYTCETERGSFRYEINLTSKTLQFNDNPALLYVETPPTVLTNQIPDAPVLSAEVDVRTPAHLPPRLTGFILYADLDETIFLLDYFSSAYGDTSTAFAPVADIMQTVNGVPCEASQ